jgi:hypothetical protein
MRKFLMWIVWNIPLGKLAPWVFVLAIGSKSERINNENKINNSN